MFRKRQGEPEQAGEMAELRPDAPLVEDDPMMSDDEYYDDEYYDDEDDGSEEPRSRDPLVSWLTLVSLMLVIVALAATASMVFFLLGMRGAPRTAVERQITQAEAAVKADSSADNYLTLAYSYLNAGRYGDATAAVDRGRKTRDDSRADLAEADILRAKEDYAGALKLYERAEKRNLEEMKKQQKSWEERGIVQPVSRETYATIMIGKAESFIGLKRNQEALKAYSAAVKSDPTNAFALSKMGDLNARLGKTKQAKAAYEEALRFIPDYEPAAEGLAKLTSAKEQ